MEYERNYDHSLYRPHQTEGERDRALEEKLRRSAISMEYDILNSRLDRKLREEREHERELTAAMRGLPDVTAYPLSDASQALEAQPNLGASPVNLPPPPATT